MKQGDSEGGKGGRTEIFSKFSSSSPPQPLLLLSVKLFRATSAARLIKFSFLQITMRKRGALLNHTSRTRYTAVYLCGGRARAEDERGGTKAA